MDKIIKIAIDGPSGAGKSTVAKLVAKKLGIEYIDTGAMYRALALKMLREGTPMEEHIELFDLLERTPIDFKDGRIYLDEQDVSDLIRTPEVSKAASDCSAFFTVRRKLVEIQQNLASQKSVIMEGRDICSVVLPDAEYKYFLTASAEKRAERRVLDLQQKGEKADYEDILQKINVRDYNDSHREVDPLKKTEDAILIDSTNMTIDEVVDFIISRIK